MSTLLSNQQGLSNISLSEQNVLATMEKARSIKESFLDIGDLLKANFEGAFWSQLGYENFKDYIESLGLFSYSWATRMINLSYVVAAQLITREDILEMGMAKAALILPALKQGKLTQDIIEIAKHAPASDLRLELGHKIQENDDCDEIYCPRCGERLYNLRWASRAKRSCVSDAT